jgi:hypothetical protein
MQAGLTLAAKPGNYANSRPNPDNTWSEIGPLSARLTHLYRASHFDADRPTLAELVGKSNRFQSCGGDLGDRFDELERCGPLQATSAGCCLPGT